MLLIESYNLGGFARERLSEQTEIFGRIISYNGKAHKEVT